MEDPPGAPRRDSQLRVRLVVGVDEHGVAPAAESGDEAAAGERHVLDAAHIDGVLLRAAAAVHQIDPVLRYMPSPHHAADLHACLHAVWCGLLAKRCSVRFTVEATLRHERCKTAAEPRDTKRYKKRHNKKNAGGASGAALPSQGDQTRNRTPGGTATKEHPTESPREPRSLMHTTIF